MCKNSRSDAASRIRACAGISHWISNPTPKPLGHRSSVHRKISSKISKRSRVRRVFSFRIEIIYKRTEWQSGQLRLKQKDTSRSFRAFLGSSFVKCQDEKTCQENLLQMHLSSKYAHQSCWPRLKICVINWCFHVEERSLVSILVYFKIKQRQSSGRPRLRICQHFAIDHRNTHVWLILLRQKQLNALFHVFCSLLDKRIFRLWRKLSKIKLAQRHFTVDQMPTCDCLASFQECK